MPQIAIAPIASPAPPPSLTAGSSEPNSFSPHLKEAIQKINGQNGNRTDENSTTTGDRVSAEAISMNSEPSFPQIVENLDMDSEQQVDEALLHANQQDDSTLLNRGESIVTLLNTPAASNPHVQDAPQLPETASIVAMLVMSGGKDQPDFPAQSSPHPLTPNFQGLLNQSTQQSADHASAFLVSLPESPTTNGTISNPLIEQLQSIIDGGEKGISLSIVASGKTLRVSTNSSIIIAKTDSLPQQPIEVVSLIEAGEGAIAPSLGALRVDGGMDHQGPAALRQSLQQQYFEGKVTLETKNDGNGNTGDKQPQNGAATPQAGLMANNDAGTLSTSETPTAFSHILAQNPSFYKPIGHESLQPVLLPSGNVVYQEEVIRHIAERFHLMRRDSDTRVNLQLHPAELGELRIDLSVKNGTVRANVVASTQIAQDILEKNMPRLRSILEQQGFSIDEILVSNSSPAVDDFNLFDRQHYDDRGSHPAPPPHSDNATAIFSLEGLNPNQEKAMGSVNVKI